MERLQKCKVDFRAASESALREGREERIRFCSGPGTHYPRVALHAYHASLKGKAAPVLNRLTADQRVFLGWAPAWAGKARPEEIRRIVASDPHTYRTYRVNGVVPYIDAWYAASG